MTSSVPTRSMEMHYDPLNAAMQRDPYPAWAALRSGAPLYFNADRGFYAVSRYRDVERSLRDWQTFTSSNGSSLEAILAEAPVPSGLFLNEDPPVHTLHRAIVARWFTPARTGLLESMIRQICSELLEEASDTGELNFVRDLGARMPVRVVGAILGLPASLQDSIRDRIDEILVSDASNEAGVSSRSNLMAYAFELLSEYIEWRSQHLADDLVSVMLQVGIDDGPQGVRTLDRDEVLIMALLLVGAGDETTVRLIGWLGYLLAAHPVQRELLTARRALISEAIEETIRFETIVPIQARKTTRAISLYGTEVPSDSIVLLLSGSANRDEREVSAPDDFVIDRRTRRHLGFGWGPHYCLGAALARLQGKIALEEVLARWSTWDIDVEHAVWSPAPTVRGWESLPAVVRR